MQRINPPGLRSDPMAVRCIYGEAEALILLARQTQHLERCYRAPWEPGDHPCTWWEG